MRRILGPSLLPVFLATLLVLGCPENGSCQEPKPPGSDDEVRALIDGGGGAAEYPGADSLVLFDRTTVDVEESGLSHTVNHVLRKVLTEKGAAGLTRLRFDYDPASNVAEVRKVRIFRKGGRIEEIGADPILDLPQPQDWILWGPRMKIVPLPRLNPGDAVESTVYHKGFMIAYLGETEDERYIPPMRGHFYDQIIFEEGVPVKLKHYTVSTPRDKPVQFEIYNGECRTYVSFSEHGNHYSFWKEEMKPFKAEAHAPAASDLATKVVLATVPDWKAKSRWFFQVNEDAHVFDSDDAIRETVAALTEGLTTDEEKIAALLHWSAQEIRYSGISMGKGEGYTIHPGIMTFHDRCGVCKDKAGMLVTMLRAAGYIVYPAMTMAGARVERIPADQFNHCVVALKQPDGSYRMLDPTWAVFSQELWSSAESEQNYVIGSPEGEELSITPLSPAGNNTISITSNASLDENGTLQGTIVVTGSGYQDQRLRRLLVHSYPAPDRRALFEIWIANIAPQAELISYTDSYDALRDLKTPIRYEIKYRIPDYGLRAGSWMTFVPPAARPFIDNPAIAPYLTSAELESRTQPLFLWCTRTLQVQETIQLPAGFRIRRLPPEKKLDGKAAALQASWRENGNAVVFSETLEMKLRTVPPEHYKNFKDVVDAVRKLPEEPVLLVSTSEKAAEGRP
jgi:hypothetical protein